MYNASLECELGMYPNINEICNLLRLQNPFNTIDF